LAAVHVRSEIVQQNETGEKGGEMTENLTREQWLERIDYKPAWLSGISWCEYGKHKVEQHSCLCYTDKTHGYPIDIAICKPCYKRHIFKYWTDSDLVKWYYEFEHEDWMDEFIQPEPEIQPTLWSANGTD
jgi:hypothetical protein